MPIPGLYKIFDHWHQEGAIWVTSDTHFSDRELRAGMPERPSDADIVRAINRKCGRRDTLIHLGDVGDVARIRELRANIKVLVCGYHDAGMTNYKRDTGHFFMVKKDYDNNLKKAYEAAQEKYPDYKLDVSDIGPAWVIWYDNHLFDFVFEGPLTLSSKLILSHEPIDLPCMFNIHGHNHTKQPNDDHHLNVCLDVTNYQPINLNQLMKGGLASKVETIHRDTINRATVRRRKRKGE